MAIPHRGNTGRGTYFITASAFQKRYLLQSERAAKLLIDVLIRYRQEHRYLLHEFVAMPNHIHLLITPLSSLERAMQCIKGGFSYRAKRELVLRGSVWESSFYDHRIRDMAEYERCRHYILQNPVKRGLVQSAEQYPYSSAAGYELDSVPAGLRFVER